ncbi:putative ribonuclease H-like domain-containing protein [Tanacetum coccineum]
MRENDKEEKVKHEMDEIETINIELEHSVAKLLSENEHLHKEIEHLKKIYKDQFDSIKKTLALSKEHDDSLIAQLNSKSMENADLKRQIQDKVFMITSLKNDLQKLKGKEVVENAAQIPIATTITPGMFKIDLEPLALRSQPTGNKRNDMILQTPSSNIKNKVELICVKCKQCMFDANHDVCFLNFVNDVNMHAKSKSKSKKSQVQNIWKPMGKVFTDVGLKWKPTGRFFTIVGNSCPLTRITPKKILHLKETTSNSVETPKSEIKVYSRRPKQIKSVGSSKKSKIVEFKIANNSEPNHLWGSNATDVPSSSSLVNDRLSRLSFASKTKSWLWHHRLSHLNFGTLNKLEKDGLARAEDTNQEKLYLLHMDLSGPMRVESINGKKYILVIFDDYSRFTWVKFLRSKDEAPYAIIKCIKNIQIEEEVYVCQPPGFEDPDFPDKVYKVEKALYGLHQAPRAWYETLSTYLLDNGFQRGKIDKTLFIKRYKDSPFDLVAYTDSDYARASLDRKSTTGGCQFLGCRLISWQCKKQPESQFHNSKLSKVAVSSCCGQFWSIVKAKTINEEEQLHALVDGEKIIITESSVRRDLQLADEEGVDCLPNSTIFEQLALTGNPKRKDTQVPQSCDPMENVADEAVHKELGDSGGPGCQETMRDTIAQTRFENVSKHSNDSLLARGNTLQSDEDRLKLDELMALCTTLQNRVLDLEKTKTSQHNEIASLKRRVKKLEKKNRSRTHKLKRLYKVGLTARVESSDDEESLGGDASKQGRIDAIDADEEITLVSAAGDKVSTASAATTVSAATTTTATISTDKGKGILIEPVKKKDQILLDEETALNLQAEFNEEERLAREKAEKKKKLILPLMKKFLLKVYKLNLMKKKDLQERKLKKKKKPILYPYKVVDSESKALVHSNLKQPHTQLLL